MLKSAELGFNLSTEGTFYAPQFLKCRAIREFSDEKSVVGSYQTQSKRLKCNRTYGLWVMYGKDESATYHLYFKEQKDQVAFKMVSGKLLFLFEAEPFMQIAMNAESHVIEYFLKNAVIDEQEEMFRFLKGIQGNVSERKRTLILDCLNM